MKNIDELYKKYYNAYKNDYDTDELNEAKKKKIDYKQFELFDKTDKRSKLDEKTKNFFKEIENRGKDKEPKLTALPKWLSSKNDFNEAIKDIRTDTNYVKSDSANKKVFNDLDNLINDIKNKKATRKITIKKIGNIVSDLDQQRQKESTVFQNKMIDVFYYLFNSLGISSQPGRLMLPKWLKISEKRFNEILSIVTEAKNNGFRTNLDGREITLDNVESFLKDLGNGKIDGREYKERYNNNVDDVEAIVNKPMITKNQEKMAKNLSLLKEILNPGNKKIDEQLDTTNMSELESEESVAKRRNQQGQGLKILTPDQMLSRLPITLAQLKAGNDSQKLINEIRQLLYFLYRSKKLTKTIYNHLNKRYLKMEKIFMSTENSKINEPHRLRL